MRLYRRILPTATWDPNTKRVEVSLPRDYFIQQILLHCTITYNTATAPTPAARAPHAAIDEVRLKRAGAYRNDDKVVGDGFSLFALDYYDKAKKGYADALSTTASQTGLTAKLLIPIDLRINKDLVDETVACEPAFLSESLKLIVSCNGSLGTDYTITNFTVRPQLVEIIPEGEQISVIDRHIELVNIGTVLANSEAELRVGYLTKRILLDFGTDVDVDYELKYKTTSLRTENMLLSAREDEIEYGLVEGHLAGITIMDFAKPKSYEECLDLRQESKGALKLIPKSNATLKLLYDFIS